jgi:hypothetical protein
MFTGSQVVSYLWLFFGVPRSCLLGLSLPKRPVTIPGEIGKLIVDINKILVDIVNVYVHKNKTDDSIVNYLHLYNMFLSISLAITNC